jgi:hypothetical protein
MREDDIRRILKDVCDELDLRALARRSAAPVAVGISMLVGSACGGQTIAAETAQQEGGVSGSSGTGGYVGQGDLYAAPTIGGSRGTGGSSIDPGSVTYYMAPPIGGFTGSGGHLGTGGHQGSGGVYAAPPIGGSPGTGGTPLDAGSVALYMGPPDAASDGAKPADSGEAG